MQLRDYQEQVVSDNIAAMERGVKSTLNPMFTGAGKTVVFCSLANRIPGRTLIIVPLKELLWQAVDKVRDILGEDPDIEMAEYRAGADDWFSPKVVVASKQTLLSRRGGQKRYERFDDFQLVIVDEAHMMCSEAVVEMLTHFQSKGAMVAGFTATPFRMDGKPMLRSEACNSTKNSSVDTTCGGPSNTGGLFPPSAN
jgi:superfamily II DNA or RNA helicase